MLFCILQYYTAYCKIEMQYRNVTDKFYTSPFKIVKAKQKIGLEFGITMVGNTSDDDIRT